VGAGASDPDEQAVSLRAKVRECGAVESLCSDDVGVVEVGELRRGERLSGAGHHVARATRAAWDVELIVPGSLEENDRAW
jgi:hypothetical protein